MTSSTASIARWIPSHRGLVAIGAAFLAGLLLFFIVWSGQRDSAPAPVRATADAKDFAPLPAPMRGADGASGMEEPDEEALAEQPRLEEAPRPATPPPAPAAPAPTRAPTAIAEAAMPTPISSPAPRYPSRALRRGETGTVRVQVDVGPDGVPTNVSVAASSNSRELDRAALDAVRKWRFKPASRDGVAVAGTVVVPIEFRL